MESNKIVFSILWFFVIYYDFFKDSAEINKKDKDKTTFKIAYNRAREVRWTFLKIEGGVLPDFRVQEKKQTFAKIEGGNMNFFHQNMMIFIFLRAQFGSSVPRGSEPKPASKPFMGHLPIYLEACPQPNQRPGPSTRTWRRATTPQGSTTWSGQEADESGEGAAKLEINVYFLNKT